MRIKSHHDLAQLGKDAKRQIQDILDRQGGFNNQKRLNDEQPLQTTSSKPNAQAKNNAPVAQKKKMSRVMQMPDGAKYCPWPSTDPFVRVIQKLEQKYGRYNDGGRVLTELIIEGGAKDWRFDIAILMPFHKVVLNGVEYFCGRTCLVEADGFGFHRSKTAFKNDRAKQTHALKNGFALTRITNEDVRERLDEIIENIDIILNQPRLYPCDYTITAKGRTQSVLTWTTE